MNRNTIHKTDNRPTVMLSESLELNTEMVDVQ